MDLIPLNHSSIMNLGSILIRGDGGRLEQRWEIWGRNINFSINKPLINMVLITLIFNRVQNNINNAALYSAIYSLSLGHNAIPPTSTNSPISSNLNTPGPDNSPDTVLHHLNATPTQTSPLPNQLDSNQGNKASSDMSRGEGPFMTNGLLQ